jgi:hypothetical protein
MNKSKSMKPSNITRAFSSLAILIRDIDDYEQYMINFLKFVLSVARSARIHETL